MTRRHGSPRWWTGRSGACTRRGEERLVAGFSPGLHVADAIRAFTAHRPEVDLDGEPMLDGRVPRAYSLEEKFELIASGRAVALVPVSVAGSYSRPDLFYLTVTDAPPVETCPSAVTA
nr:hypothetical protein [Streptomyces sp. ET3-23]